MARMERYFICASASSALKITASGWPRRTAEPSSTDTWRTIPPTKACTLVSRYAFEATVAGTLTIAGVVSTRTSAILIPARATASGVRVTSTGSSLFAVVVGGVAIPGLAALPVGAEDRSLLTAGWRSPHITPAVTPTARNTTPPTATTTYRRHGSVLRSL